MPFSVTYNPQAGYVRATVVGPVDVALAREILKEVARRCQATGCRRILNDARKATFAMDLLDLNLLPELVTEAGIPPGSRRAFLVSGYLREHQFLQGVSLLHDQKALVFDDLGEARRWLAKDEDTPTGGWRDGGPPGAELAVKLREVLDAPGRTTSRRAKV